MVILLYIANVALQSILLGNAIVGGRHPTLLIWHSILLVISLWLFIFFMLRRPLLLQGELYREGAAAQYVDPALAEERALKLFLESLTPGEFEEFKTNRRVTFRGSDQQWYVLDCSGPRSHNVYELRKTAWGTYDRIRSWCGFPVITAISGAHCYLPLGDHLLGQKLLLQTDAPAFKSVAIRGPR